MFRLALAQGVVDLQELRPILAHSFLQGVVRASPVVCESAVANLLLVLEFPNTVYVHGRVTEVMHLHQVDDIRVHEPCRSRHLLDAGTAPVGPDLCGNEHGFTWGAARDDVTDDPLRAVIHR